MTDDKMKLLTLDGWAAFARRRRGDELELRGGEEEENGGPSRARRAGNGGEGREVEEDMGADLVAVRVTARD